ncbi:MAG: type II toxin-antitoxin system Phd/YefM family antitoxin [Burkholderiaceae bacterium]
MKTIRSSDVQSRFGEVLDQAKRDPVTVTQYGRPVVVMMGYEEATEAMRLLAARKMIDMLDDLPLNPEAEALTEDDINRLIDER